MAEIEITLPTVQYGNVKVRATPEELGADLESPHSLGVALAVFQNLFTQGWVEGSRMDVSAPVGASQHDDMVRAHEILAEGLGGVTEVPAGDVVAHEENQYDRKHEVLSGGVQDDAPWNQKVDVKPKPWETGSTPPEAVVTAPVVLEATW